MTTPLIGTSWKMNLTPSLAAAYCTALRALVADVEDRTLFVLPPFTAIPAARAALAGSNVAWGAQDVHPLDSGAHTGDVSAPMLADLGCTFVEVGHHERRRDHREDDELIARKVAAVQRWGMTAILCVGETSKTTIAAAEKHVSDQLRRAGEFDIARLVIAYEPAWAIGVGAESAPSDWVAGVHAAVHRRLENLTGGRSVPVIYGGSVDLDGAAPLLATAGVDGLFVGRHALTAEGFARIAHTPPVGGAPEAAVAPRT
jgi:triosephosphate isomerase